MNEASVHFVGNVGSEPVLRFTESKKAVLNFRVAVNQRKKIGDEWKDTNATWYEVTIWGAQAERAVEVIKQGARVFVVGRLIAEQYENKEGVKGMSLKVDADACGLDLLGPAKTQQNDDPWNAQ
jgi:single-strand DNA-binding protein